MQKNKYHWTEKRGAFKFYILDELIDKLMDISSNATSKEIIKKINTNSHLFSKILNNPIYFPISLAIRWVRVMGLKLSIVIYDDGDKNNELGPIPSEIFSKCWELLGKPKNFFEFKDIESRQKRLNKIKEKPKKLRKK